MYDQNILMYSMDQIIISRSQIKIRILFPSPITPYIN